MIQDFKENTNSRIESRNLNFLKTPALNSNFSVQLRKAKRNSEVSKKRFKNSCPNTHPSSCSIFSLFSSTLASSHTFSSLSCLLDSLIETLDQDSFELNLNPNDEQLFIKSFFCLITGEFNQTFQEEISFIMLLLIEKCESSTTQELIKRGIISYTIRMLNTINTTILKNYISVIGLFSSFSFKSAEEIIEIGFICKLEQVYIKVKDDEELKKLLVWIVANLTRKEVNLSLQHSCAIVKFLMKFYINYDTLVSYEVLRTFCGISYRSYEFIQILIENSVHFLCFEMIKSQMEQIQLSSIRILSNMAFESLTHIYVLINSKILNHFLAAVGGSSMIKAELFKAISNIVMGSPSQIVIVVEHPIFKHVVQGLIDRNSTVRVESSIVIRNVSLYGCSAAIDVVINLGIFEMLINAFDDFENEVVFNCAVAALNLYNYARNNRYDIAENSGILNSLEDMIVKKKFFQCNKLLEEFNKVEMEF